MAAAAGKREMASRISVGAVGLPLLVLLVWIGSPWFSVLVAAVAAIGALELCRMARLWGDRPVVPVAVTWAVVFVAAGHLLDDGSSAVTSVMPIVSVAAGILLVSILWCHGSGTRLSGWGVTAGAALYTGGLLSHAPLLRALDQGLEWVLLLLFVTFAMDTCSFFVGRALGRRPLAPSISPSKTWEGAAGGVAGAVAAGVSAVYLLSLDAVLVEAAVLSALLGVVGQAGDLVESRLKRIAGVEDSGRLLPGHGGVLDRLDSIVFNLVVVYYFAL